jgi:hypothetical protein
VSFVGFFPTDHEKTILPTNPHNSCLPLFLYCLTKARHFALAGSFNYGSRSCRRSKKNIYKWIVSEVTAHVTGQGIFNATDPFLSPMSSPSLPSFLFVCYLSFLCSCSMVISPSSSSEEDEMVIIVDIRI